MASARERAREAVDERYKHAHLIKTSVVGQLADAASNVWEPIATTLRDHVPEPGGGCLGCPLKDGFYQGWPCAARKQAVKALA